MKWTAPSYRQLLLVLYAVSSTSLSDIRLVPSLSLLSPATLTDMHLRNFIPALALLAPLVAAQDSDTPIVDAFLDYMESEGLSSLQAEGLTAQASIYSSLVDSIQGVLAVSSNRAPVLLDIL